MNNRATLVHRRTPGEAWTGIHRFSCRARAYDVISDVGGRKPDDECPGTLTYHAVHCLRDQDNVSGHLAVGKSLGHGTRPRSSLLEPRDTV